MFEKLQQFFSKFSSGSETSWFAVHKNLLTNLFLIILGNYLLAAALNASLLPKFMKSISSTPMRSGKDNDSSSQGVTQKNLANYHEIKKSVVERNVFNSSGEFPQEESGDEASKAKGAFDIEAPCEKTSLKIKLVGMISLEEKGSIATIKEDGFDTADVYSEGDIIVGSDTAQIVRIQSGKVIINNGGRKECLDLKLGDEKFKAGGPSGKGGISMEEESVIDLDAKYVQNELGEGFGKVIQSARLVPNTVNNQVNGFKIFGIQAGTLLDKIGFKENDVITRVNNVVMEAEQGFALYQALNDEKQIRIHVLRNGTVPKTLAVRVK
jgi:type II secretion system protein C